MAKALEEFLNVANSNTIRCTNQFEVYCTSGYSEIDSVLENATIYGQSFNIPSRGVDYANVSFKGYEMVNVVPTRLTMENEHTMTILDDVNGELRRAFLAWQGKVINPDIEGGSVFEGDRGINGQSLIRLHLFDKDNQTVIQKYKFYNIRVTNVGAVSLSYEGGEASKFEVTFKSTYWTIEEAKNGALTDQK